MKTFLLFLLLITFNANLTHAEDAKFTIEEDTLYYNTEKKDLKSGYVSYSDIYSFRKFLNENPNISKVNLNSSGGSAGAGLEIFRVLSDFNVDTVVSNECSSACINIFLAGNVRWLHLGALLGFHRPDWDAVSMQEYFNNYKEEEKWSDTFEFSNWIQKDTILITSKIFKNYTDAGVNVSLTVDTLKIDNDDMWYPSRQELTSAGVVSLIPIAVNKPQLRPMNLGLSSPELKLSMME